MSWVSYAKLQTLCNALRQKFTSGEIVLANDAKNVGVHFNHTAQDGLVAISPMTEDGSTPAALWVTDSEANNATEITAGTFSYVTDNGKDTEDFTSMSLVGGVVNVSGKNGAARKITNVATPTNDSDVATKKYVDDNAGSSPVFDFSSPSMQRETITIPTTAGKFIQTKICDFYSGKNYIFTGNLNLWIEAHTGIIDVAFYKDNSSIQYIQIPASTTEQIFVIPFNRAFKGSQWTLSIGMTIQNGNIPSFSVHNFEYNYSTIKG